MIYDFDQITDRRGSGSMKWDSGAADVLPMWVADMDFRVAQPILDALQERTEHGIFGYSLPDDGYYDALIGWFSRRHGWNIERDWLCHSPGIVPALHFFSKAFVQPGDKIMMLSPVYYPFFGAAKKNGVEVAYSELLEVNGRYEINFEDFETIARDPQVKLCFLSSPHNPGGRIWTREELGKMGRICTENGVLVVSDEIHCDLVFPGHENTPYGTLAEDIVDNSIICVAPSKTFNLAGLQTSCLIIRNPEIREKYKAFLDSIGIMRPGAYGIAGLKAAYAHGDEWLDQLLAYLAGNLDFMREYLAKQALGVKIMEPDATYLVFLDFSAYGRDPVELHKAFLDEGKIWLDEGYMFGKASEKFERINIACPRSVLKDGLDRIISVLKK